MRAVTLLTVLAGCGVGDGRGALSGTLFVDECTTTTSIGALGAPAPYDMRPSFFVADITRDLPRLHPVNRLVVRVQSSGNRVEEADVLLVSVADVGLLAQSLGQPIAVGPTTNVRATLYLHRSCPAISVQHELDGAMQWMRLGTAGAGPVPNNFSINFGDTLNATFDFDVIDRRAIALGGTGSVPVAPRAGGHLAGFFDFIVRQGKSAQAYP